jgi:hypothetical protein
MVSCFGIAGRRVLLSAAFGVRTGFVPHLSPASSSAKLVNSLLVLQGR